ncbi:MAG: short-chain fatty acyl-CoA regulator family protein [Alkalilacustris sp.]
MPRSALIGSRIRARRIVLGLSQAALARRVGISASYLNLIEHNRRRVGEDLLGRLATALGLGAEALREGAGAALIDALREAAAAAPADAPALPETERAEEFAGRFPGWAALTAAQARRLAQLERSVERLTDRMAHDPHLSAALHELLSVAAALRSTAAILAETEDLSAEWRGQFLSNLERDSQRLAEGAQALVGYLDTAEPEESGLAAPQEELEAWLAERGWHVAELESEAGRSEGAREALVAGAPALMSSSARALARAHLGRAQGDAAALPLGRLRAALAAHGPDPGALAGALGVGGDLPRLFRRLAALPEGFGGLPPLGLVVCDGSGTLTFRRPLPGFGLPRFGAACPLWPLFQALAQPLKPLRVTVETAGRLPQRFETFSVCSPVAPAGFGVPAVWEASMLILPAEGEGPAHPPAQPVGTSCRICPRPACAARREPALVA